jgi:cell division protein FtsN
MNWLRRNWVDALMGALIVAVVGGVLVLLLRGTGTPNNAANPTPPTPTAKPVAPASPAPQTSSTPPATPPAPSSTKLPAKPPAPQASTQPAQKPLEVPAIPSVGETQPAPVAAQPSRKPSVVTAKTMTRPTLARDATTAAPVKPKNYNRADFLKNYRVAVGTYSSAARGQSAAQKLRANGFPAQAFSSGAAFIVVVGPYTRESSARAAFNKLRALGFPDAVLYAPNGKRERVTTGGRTSAPATVASSKPTATGGVGSNPVKLDPGYMSYLQVGAFKDTQSALPLLQQLKGSGFKALLRAAMDGYVRVLVGPYNNNALEAAKESLKGQGLTPFAVQQ